MPSNGTSVTVDRHAPPEGEGGLSWADSVRANLRSLLEAIPDAAMVMDRERRILLANANLFRTFGIDPGQVAGRRPGEALGCLFAQEGPAGCGSGVHCSVCGTLRSVLHSQESGKQDVQECHFPVGSRDEIPLDLEVTSTPAVVDGMPVTVCVLKDISAEKRRGVLERLFFHDVINTVGGIHGVAELLNGSIPLNRQQETEYKQWVLALSKKLIEEIQHHRKLLAAERGEFKPELGVISIPELAQELQILYASHEIAEGRQLVLGEVCGCQVISDANILRRILGNLLKNALEASKPGETVTLSCSDDADAVTFRVHNQGVIPPEIQLQIFRRSFSTKGGGGRGMGTYSVKLFGERYLHGTVDFTSSKAAGTTFTFTLPKQP